MVKKLTIRESKNINNPDILINIIYNNFIEISSDPSLKHNKEEIKRLLTDPNFYGFFIYDENNKIIAYLVGERLTLNDGRLVYYITYVYVLKKYRGHNIGSQLLKFLMNRCEDWGIKFIMLTCDSQDEKVYNFYLKRGFRKDPILKTEKRHEVLIYCM